MIFWFLNDIPAEFSTFKPKKPEIADKNSVSSNPNSVNNSNTPKNKRYISKSRVTNKNKKRPNNKSRRS